MNYAEQFMDSRGRLFTFRSLVRQWTPVTENEIYVVLGLYLSVVIIQKPSLQTYFSRKRILSTPGFGDVPAKLYKIFPVLSHLNYKFQNIFLTG
jgi:hypothetical protein